MIVVPGTVTSSPKGELQSISTDAPSIWVVVVVVEVGMALVIVVTGAGVEEGMILVVVVTGAGGGGGLLSLQQSAPSTQLLPVDEKSLRQLSDPHTKSP